MMGNYLQDHPVEVIKAIDEIASGINAGETLVFCGAGISHSSGLPVVNQLIPYIFLTLSASREQVHIIEEELKDIEDPHVSFYELIKKLHTLTDVSEQVIGKVMSALPFEAFIEVLAENSQIDNILDIYDANSYEPSIEPNSNHSLLAKLVAAGKVKTIVTTNFDQLIEKALKREGRIEGSDYDVLYREEDFEKINWATDRIRLIKLHGSIHDKQAMAITLRKVARKELSEGRANIIRHVFAQGNHKQVLILGYSCSDIFDVSPQIESLRGSIKRVSLIQHFGGQRIEDIRKLEVKNPFKSFENGERLFLNSDHMVQSLWESTLGDSYQVNELDTTEWKEKVNEWHTAIDQHRRVIIEHTILGQLFDAVTDWPTAMRFYEKSLASSKENYDKQGEEVALGMMGRVYVNSGDYPKAIEFFKKALKIARQIGDIQVEGKSLSGMGRAYASLCDYSKAFRFFEKALKIARQTGDKRGEGAALGGMGNVLVERGEYFKAIEFYEKALEIARQIGDVKAEGISLGSIGVAYRNLEEYQKSIEFCEADLDIARRIGDMQGEGSALCNMGVAYMQLDKNEKAIELYEMALETARLIGNLRSEGVALVNMGIAYMNLGDQSKAVELLQKALEIARQIGDVRNEGHAFCNMGLAHAGMGNKQEAYACLEASKGIFERLGLKHAIEQIEMLMKSAGL
jgi:tetratricopeptide (TPR) repeat protein